MGCGCGGGGGYEQRGRWCLSCGRDTAVAPAGQATVGTATVGTGQLPLGQLPLGQFPYAPFATPAVRRVFYFRTPAYWFTRTNTACGVWNQLTREEKMRRVLNALVLANRPSGPDVVAQIVDDINVHCARVTLPVVPFVTYPRPVYYWPYRLGAFPRDVPRPHRR